MQEPTTSELMRIIQQMAEDARVHRMELKDTIDEMRSDIKDLKETVGEVKVQTTKTNGNVIRLNAEVFGDQGKEGMVKSLDALRSRERYVAGALAVCFALFGLVPFFMNLYIKDSVEKALTVIEQRDKITDKQ